MDGFFHRCGGKENMRKLADDKDVPSSDSRDPNFRARNHAWPRNSMTENSFRSSTLEGANSLLRMASAPIMKPAIWPTFTRSISKWPREPSSATEAVFCGHLQELFSRVYVLLLKNVLVHMARRVGFP